MKYKAYNFAVGKWQKEKLSWFHKTFFKKKCKKDKMKVIFVIQGEGRGHLTQALALGQMLRHEGHEVVKVLVGKSKNRVIPTFFEKQIGCGIEQFYSPNFRPSKDNRRFNLLRSITYNVALIP